MPDRDKEALQARNADTQITIRAPAGLKPRVREAAKQASISVSAFVVAAIEDKLQGRDSGTTAPSVILREPGRPAHSPACKCGICKPAGGK